MDRDLNSSADGDKDQIGRDRNSNLQSTNKDGQEKSASRKLLESWLNKNMKIGMTDGRTLIGVFLCTDRDRNVILGSCSEYLKPDEDGTTEEPRVLGLAMVPGHHIVSIHIDKSLPNDVLVM